MMAAEVPARNSGGGSHACHLTGNLLQAKQMPCALLDDLEALAFWTLVFPAWPIWPIDNSALKSPEVRDLKTSL